jgi:hypothetical protein
MAGRKKEAVAEEVEEAPAVEEASEKRCDYQPMDPVKVRFTGEFGILAGKAVHQGEVHTVRYWQYLAARETGGEAYQLVDPAPYRDSAPSGVE